MLLPEDNIPASTKRATLVHIFFLDWSYSCIFDIVMPLHQRNLLEDYLFLKKLSTLTFQMGEGGGVH